MLNSLKLEKQVNQQLSAIWLHISFVIRDSALLEHTAYKSVLVPSPHQYKL